MSTAAKGKCHRHKRHHWKRSWGWDWPYQSRLGHACRKHTSHWGHCSHPLPSLWDSCPPRMLGRVSTSTGIGSPPSLLSLSSPVSTRSTCIHTHSHTHTASSLYISGQVKGAHKPFFPLHTSETSIFLDSSAWPLHYGYFWMLILKSQLATWGVLGSASDVQTPTTIWNQLRIPDQTPSSTNILGKNLLFLRCENATCRVTFVDIFVHCLDIFKRGEFSFSMGKYGTEQKRDQRKTRLS